MPYPNAHLYARFNGAFGSATGNEKWSAGLRLGIVGADVPYNAASLQALANSIHTAASTFHTTTNTGTGTKTYFVNVSLARVGVDGTYDPPGQLTVISAGAPIAGVVAGIHPWSTAMVVSLRTQNPRGIASNGRVYWPAVSMGLDENTGRTGPTGLTARINAFKTLINAINTAANTYQQNTTVVVVSKVGAGAMARVTAIRSDERLDNIERRENSAPPAWVSVPIP